MGGEVKRLKKKKDYILIKKLISKSMQSSPSKLFISTCLNLIHYILILFDYFYMLQPQSEARVEISTMSIVMPLFIIFVKKGVLF